MFEDLHRSFAARRSFLQSRGEFLAGRAETAIAHEDHLVASEQLAFK